MQLIECNQVSVPPRPPGGNRLGHFPAAAGLCSNYGHRKPALCPSSRTLRSLQASTATTKQLGTTGRAETWGSEPWTTIFDLRERDSAWLDTQQEALVKAFATKELNIELEELEERLQQLSSLLPDIGSKVRTLRLATLAELLRNHTVIAERLVQLRQMLPFVNVSRLVSKDVNLVLQDPQQLAAQVAEVAQALAVDEAQVQNLIEKQPRFVNPEHVNDVLDELRRLMPKRDARSTLVDDPSWLLKVERGTKYMGPHPNEM